MRITFALYCPNKSVPLYNFGYGSFFHIHANIITYNHMCCCRQKELFSVLKAYSVLNKKVGYCQAQAPVAAFLLMHMPAEQAFWCLVSVCDKYLFGYYSQGMVSTSVRIKRDNHNPFLVIILGDHADRW
jgi:hypothetical protein